MSTIARSISRLALRANMNGASRAISYASTARASSTLLASNVTRAPITKSSFVVQQRSAFSQWVAPTVTYNELKPLTRQPSVDRYLIDVREPDEVAAGAIPSSVSLPLSALPGAFHLPPDKFRNTYGFEKPTKNQELIFYCRSGKRSTTASEHAKEYGYANIKNYVGSWQDWSEREGKKD